ncbi:MAG: alpha/beta hydrolase [Planctomycetaceae bacterium]
MTTHQESIQPDDSTKPAPDSEIQRVRKPFWQQLLRAICIYLAIPYLTVVVIFVVFQRRLLYRPTQSEGLSAADMIIREAACTDVELQTPDGQYLRGWYVRRQSPEEHQDRDRYLIIYFPGNAGNRSIRADVLRDFSMMGADALLLDYRGYGDSSGTPSELNLAADAGLIWQFAQQKLGYARDHLIIFGESMGGAVSLSLWDPKLHPATTPDSVQPQVAKALILNSTFASIPRVAQQTYPMFPFRYFVQDRWQSEERICHVDVLAIIFHGTNDELIPIAEARRLQSFGPKGTELIEIPGGTHNDIPTEQLRQVIQGLMESAE